MATKLKQIIAYVRPEYREELKDILKQENIRTSEFIIQAIDEKVQRDFDTTLQPASAPHGVRSDALPTGWKSRLYKDRYQIIAKWTGSGEGFILCHYHEFTENLENRIYKTVRTEEGQPAEVTIIDIPTDHPFSIENAMKEIESAYLEWLPHS